VSDFSTKLDLLGETQANKEERANALFDALSQALLFGRRDSTSAGLTWGYFGGRFNVRGTPTDIANGTVTLTASQTNYVEVNGQGTVSVNTSAFGADKIPLYTVVTNTTGPTSWTDYRPLGHDPRANIVTANTGAAYAIDLRLAEVFNLTLTADCAITFTNPASAPVRVHRFLIYLKQDATGGRAVTWPSTLQWAPLASPPPFVTLPNALNIIEVMSIDGGTTYQAREWASDAA
jgi:hypothetical protein